MRLALQNMFKPVGETNEVLLVDAKVAASIAPAHFFPGLLDPWVAVDGSEYPEPERRS